MQKLLVALAVAGVLFGGLAAASAGFAGDFVTVARPPVPVLLASR